MREATALVKQRNQGGSSARARAYLHTAQSISYARTFARYP